VTKGPSLYWRTIGVITVVMSLAAAALGAAAWYYARLAADDAYDRLLIGAALQIAEGIYIHEGVVGVDPPIATFETLALAPNDRIFYKVTDPGGRVLTGYDDFEPAAPGKLTKTEPFVIDGEHLGLGLRVAVVGRYIADIASPGWAQVVLGQTREARLELARDLTAKALILLLAMMALAFVGVLFAVRYALAPLARIELALRSRDPKDLNPLRVETPQEIEALVSSINHFMSRLAGRTAVMQRFIADATHQIRTPLTALASQVEMLATADDRLHDQHLARVRERTSELGRLTNQLLNHAMVIHRAEVVRLEPLDLGALARQVLVNAIPLSLERDVAVAFEDPPGPVYVAGDEVSLREALSNLVHNALKYGAQTRLEMRVCAEGTCGVVCVIDDGPGIPVSEWQRVTQPFHRQSGTGSGLGLAIVSDVVRAHGGELEFRERSHDGFAVIIRLPYARTSVSAPGARP
jgi:two-component system sensor histidine kinase TctE